jgi:hypothetical protein
MKRLFFLILVFISQTARSQSLYFPPITGNTWDTISPSTLGWCPDQLDSLLDFVGQRNSKAFILLKDGKIVAERYYGTFTRDSLWYWASAGKSLTAFLTGLAQESGYLSIGDTTSSYLGQGWTSCTPQQEERITILNQLTMTTGLDDGVPDDDCTDDTCLQYLADPGTRWAYHNAPYTLLDPVIETATGQTLTQFFNQRLTSTTGMTGFYFQSGYNNVFISKARSMARFGLLVLNHGRWNNTTVMNDSLYFNAMVNSSQPLNPSYGYLWWLNGKSSFMAPGFQFQFPGSWSPAAPPDMFAAMGKNGQLLNIVPSMNLVWVRMGDEPSGSFVPFALNDTIWQKLNAVMCTSTGVQSPDITSSIKVSPNPATELLQIVSPRCTLQIMDATGREVELITINEPMIQLPLTMYQSGIYFFRFVLADGKVITKKVIVR